MPEITDEYMKAMRATAQDYCLMMLKAGPNFSMPDAQKIIWD